MAALILGVAETSFGEALILAACSATITGIFLVVSSYVQARYTGQKVDEVRAKVEAKATAEGIDLTTAKHDSGEKPNVP